MLTLPPYYITKKQIKRNRSISYSKNEGEKEVRITNSISLKKVTNMLKKTQVSSLADEDTCDGC